MSDSLALRADGTVAMAYTGEKPWHGTGQRLTQGASIEQWGKESGMSSFRIARSRVRFGEGEQAKIFEDHHVLFRSDNKLPLAIVGKDFKIVQPLEILEFFRDLVGVGGFELCTAGVLFNGRKYWAQADIGESAIITGNDRINGRLLLCTACDGTMKTIVKNVAERVVCNNTLSMALRERDKVTIGISHRSDFDATKIKEQLGIEVGQFAEFIKASRALAEVKVSHMRAEQLTEALLTDTKTVTKDNVQRSSGFLRIMEAFKNGKGNNGRTAWDWVNGVTEFVDHTQRATSDENRLSNSWFGRGDTLKTAAFERAQALV